ncbi:FtsQ-type POTRA domain-containing protein [Alphaproteobacteria bacterium]|nr:FtsQ-type POTRA domain-containing protein [Alphaproteobacteria bacterium]
MLRLKLNKKNLLKAKFYGFETEKLTRLINLSFLLLFILFFCGFYFLDGLSKDDIINKLKPSDQFLIKNGFKIENVLITGTRNLSNNYIKDTIEIYNDGSIFNIDLSSIYNEIKQNAWVKEVSIERILPNIIKIKILENQPIAIWQNKKNNKLITANGDIIFDGNVNDFKNDFPIIKGNKSKENISSILKILETNQSFYKNIWSLTFINERRWDLHFNQGLVVRLPSKGIKKAWEKIIKLQKNYNVLNLRLTEIDLRNPKQILGKINFDKKFILKRKHL